MADLIPECWCDEDPCICPGAPGRTGGKDFEVYSVGLVHASTCTSLTDEEATTEINVSHPTGVSSDWQITGEAFADGTPNGTPCPVRPHTHRHLLFTC